jgi:hypothetical protein
MEKKKSCVQFASEKIGNCRFTSSNLSRPSISVDVNSFDACNLAGSIDLKDLISPTD